MDHVLRGDRPQPAVGRRVASQSKMHWTIKTTTYTPQVKARINESRLVQEHQPILRTHRVSGAERPRPRSARGVQSRTFRVSATSLTTFAGARRGPPVSGWYDALLRPG